MFGDAVEDVDVEWLADLIARQILEAGVDDESIGAAGPCRRWRESPLRLLAIDSDCTSDATACTGDLHHALEQRIAHRSIEMDDRWLTRAGARRGNLPPRRIGRHPDRRSAPKRFPIGLDERNTARVGPLAIDHEGIALAVGDRRPHFLVGVESAFDAPGIEGRRKALAGRIPQFLPGQELAGEFARVFVEQVNAPRGLA